GGGGRAGATGGAGGPGIGGVGGCAGRAGGGRAGRPGAGGTGGPGAGAAEWGGPACWRPAAGSPGGDDPRLRAPVVAARRRQGAGDPRHLRTLAHALLPAAQRPAGPPRGAGLRSGPGQPVAPAARLPSPVPAAMSAGAPRGGKPVVWVPYPEVVPELPGSLVVDIYDGK